MEYAHLIAAILLSFACGFSLRNKDYWYTVGFAILVVANILLFIE